MTVSAVEEMGFQRDTHIGNINSVPDKICNIYEEVFTPSYFWLRVIACYG